MKTHGQKMSQKQEKDLAKTLGGKTVAASGAFWSRKGDVRSDQYLVEAKFTAAQSYSLKAADLEKLRKQAIMDDRVPLFVVQLNNKNYMILGEDDWLELTGAGLP